MDYKLFFPILQIFLKKKKTKLFPVKKMMCPVFAVSFSDRDVFSYLYFNLQSV